MVMAMGAGGGAFETLAIGDKPGLGSDSADTVHGNDGGDDLFLGAGGDDWFAGYGGADLAYGNGDSDVLFGDAGADTLYGGQQSDFVDGGAGDDIIYGNRDVDTMAGGTGHDVLYGGGGNDILSGEAGNDILVGGGGYDTLVGGDGADSFAFNSTNDSPWNFDDPTLYDTIYNFNPATDIIDLSGIDANEDVEGNQAFTSFQTDVDSGTPVGTFKILQTGYDPTLGTTDLLINTSSSGGYDMQIVLDGWVDLTSANFIM